MKFILSLLSITILFAGCSTMPKNRALDKFIWDIQYADYENDKVKEMGTTDLKSFLSEVDKFPWYEQSVAANNLQRSSPTISVNDLKTDKALFISSGIDESNGDFGYFVGYICPDSKNSLYVKTYIVDGMIEVEAIITNFFCRDYNRLTALLERNELFLETPSSRSWKEYLKEKQMYY